MTLERTIGRMLRPFRAGDRHLVWNQRTPRDIPGSIVLASSAFAEGTPMPRRHAGAGIGDNISPPLNWSNVPPGTLELVLIMQDPDAPLPRPVTHVVAVGIAPDRDRPDRGHIDEAALSSGKNPTIRFGRGSFRRIGYAGPRPPAGHGPHRYVFQIYALTERLPASAIPDLGSVTAAIAKSAIARGRLIGTFERS